MSARIPERLRSYVRNDDVPYVPTGGLDDLCGWDWTLDIDAVGEVIVTVMGAPYGPTTGRMCRTCYIAVLEGRAQKADLFEANGTAYTLADL